MSRCVVPNCDSRLGTGVPFFGFPVDQNRRAEWIELLNLQEDKLLKTGRICIRHFRSDYLMVSDKRCTLRVWAKPRIEAYGSDESEPVSKESLILH